MQEKEIKILGLDGKPINGVPTISRKERKEQKRYQATLLNLVNQYLTFCSESTDKKQCDAKFVELNHKWIEYALKWNADFSNKSVLRITDFTNFIEDYEKKQEKETE